MNAFECPFSKHARYQPNQVALKQGKNSWTYLQCHEWINGLTKTLQNIGISTGDPVAIYPDKTLLMPLLFFFIISPRCHCFSSKPPSSQKRTYQAA